MSQSVVCPAPCADASSSSSPTLDCARGARRKNRGNRAAIGGRGNSSPAAERSFLSLLPTVAFDRGGATCSSWATSLPPARTGGRGAASLGSRRNSSNDGDGFGIDGRDFMGGGSPSSFLRGVLLKRTRGRRIPRLSGARSSLQDAQDLVQSGAVQPCQPDEACPLLSEGGYRLLDVRPVWEYERAHLKSGLHVPLFVEDADRSPIGLLKSSIHMGYGGLWMGTKMVKWNEGFVDQVRQSAATNDKLIVACGEGLRSLLAIEELHNAGFTNMVWLRGGFNAAKLEDFLEVVGDTELRFATVGGVSKLFLSLTLLLTNISKKLSPTQSST